MLIGLTLWTLLHDHPSFRMRLGIFMGWIGTDQSECTALKWDKNSHRLQAPADLLTLVNKSCRCGVRAEHVVMDGYVSSVDVDVFVLLMSPCY